MPRPDREKSRVYNQNRYRRVRAIINALKSNPCADCGGVFPPECMDFDHVRGRKSFPIGPGTSRSLPKLMAEIEKCDLVCSNCHRIRTKRRKREEHGS